MSYMLLVKAVNVVLHNTSQLVNSQYYMLLAKLPENSQHYMLLARAGVVLLAVLDTKSCT